MNYTGYVKQSGIIGNDERNSIFLLFRFGLKSGVPRNVRSMSYLGFKEDKFITSIEEVVHMILTALFVSVIVGAYASKAKCKAIWYGTFSVGGGGGAGGMRR